MALSQNIKTIWQHLISKNTFGSVLQKIDILSAENGKCTAELKVSDEHANSMGNLHGGMTATIVDVVSTLALTTSKRAAIGVSVDMSIMYLKGAPIGELVIISANTLKAGKTLAFLEVMISKKSNGDLVAKGCHTKFIGSESPLPK
uniref:Acyl-coenzyme A thioesterase 13 n=1 Tax=Clastoptera arizonana TaxID=38151 RepID=A0A1B6D0H2_9HEMI